MAGKIEGKVQSIDAFGNLITDIPAASLASAPRDENVTIRCDEHETIGIFDRYEDQPQMTLIARLSRAGQLEMGIVGESAAAMLGVRVGEKVVVKW